MPYQKTPNHLAANIKPRPISYRTLVFKGKKITEHTHSCSSCK